MVRVTIEVDSWRAKVARSPVYWIVAPLQGVALTFAPLFLYWCGKGTISPGAGRIVVPACVAAILLVGLFNGALAAPVVKELRERRESPAAPPA
jgi:hypothetical protein